MKPADGRNLSMEVLNERRRLAVRLRLSGMKVAEVAVQADLSAPTVIAAYKAYLAGGWDAVPVKPRGRSPGTGRTLSEAQEDETFRLVIRHLPDQFGLSFALWQWEAVQALVAQRYEIELPTRTVDRYLKRWGFVAQRSVDRPEETQDREIRRWFKTTYPALLARAKTGSAEVQWLSEAPLRGEAQGERRNLICAITNRGKLRWMVYEGNLSQTVLTDFLTRLGSEAGRRLVLVVDGLRLDRAAGLQAWLGERMGQFELVQLGAQPAIGSAIERTPRLRAISGSTIQNQILTAVPTPRRPPVQTAAKEKHLMAVSNLPPSDASIRDNLGVKKTMSLTHLQRLEAESIHIMREVVAEADNPVMLYSIGKDSSVMLHLAMKAFYPAKPPFPLLHVDTTWKFQDMYRFRDETARRLGLDLLVHINPEGVEKSINPFTHGSQIHTDIWKTQGLKQALDKYGFDAAFGGGRRDEEKSRAKERIFSFRTAQHRWDPKNQRPELWRLYNARKHKGESIRVFPISNWTELDIWQYIYLENIPIVPLYFSKERPVVERDGTLIMVDDDRMPLNPGEVPMMRSVRFRTLGCYPLSGAIESDADTLPSIIQEMLLTKTSERQGRMIDHDTAASMEKKKQEGYF